MGLAGRIAGNEGGRRRVRMPRIGPRRARAVARRALERLARPRHDAFACASTPRRPARGGDARQSRSGRGDAAGKARGPASPPPAAIHAGKEHRALDSGAGARRGKAPDPAVGSARRARADCVARERPRSPGPVRRDPDGAPARPVRAERRTRRGALAARLDGNGCRPVRPCGRPQSSASGRAFAPGARTHAPIVGRRQRSVHESLCIDDNEHGGPAIEAGACDPAGAAASRAERTPADSRAGNASQQATTARHARSGARAVVPRARRHQQGSRSSRMRAEAGLKARAALLEAHPGLRQRVESSRPRITRASTAASCA